MQPRDLVVTQSTGELQERKPRGLQDLVRVGVADAARKMRIGERALERVVLSRERVSERLGVQRFNPTVSEEEGRADRGFRGPNRSSGPA